jgi:hypothetical protein
MLLSFVITKNTIKLFNKMALLLIWHILKIIVDPFSFIVNVCILNQYNSHWLPLNAL